MMFNQEITLFNKRVNKTTRREAYIPTLIQGVSFIETKSVGGTDDRADNDSCTIRIPKNAVIQSGRTYLEEHFYKQLNDSDAMKYWTIQRDAYIVRGNHSAELLIEPSKIEELKRDRKVITVRTYVDNTERGSHYIKHWRIGGA